MADRNDANAPGRLLIPIWKPDGYSVRMAVRNFLRGSSAYAALTGVGVRPAPQGASESEGTKSDTWLPPQQFFRSAVARVSDPTEKTLPAGASYPSADSPGVPIWLAEMTAHQLAGRS